MTIRKNNVRPPEDAVEAKPMFEGADARDDASTAATAPLLDIELRLRVADRKLAADLLAALLRASGTA